jgi:hypothetical protein
MNQCIATSMNGMPLPIREAMACLFSTDSEKYIRMLKKKNIPANTLLKIDVEGYELNVLKGSQHILKKINYVIIENQFFTMYLNSKFKKCDTLLLKNNFKLLKRFIFPLLNFEDRLYIKNKDLIFIVDAIKNFYNYECKIHKS